MIYVHYDYDAILSTDKTLPILEVQLGEKVKYDYERGCWYTYNYFRGNITDENGKIRKRKLQIGIMIEGEDLEGVEVYFVSTDGANKRKLYCDTKKKLWFELSRFIKKKGRYCYDEGDWVTGVVYSGTINIVVERNEKVELTEKLAFFPSGIPLEDYEAMISDLFRIRESLVRRKQTNISVNTKEVRTPERLLQIVKGLETPIRIISTTPAGELSFRWEKRKVSNVGKFYPRTELEREINPGKDKYKTFVTYENHTIYENKIIKQELQRLKEYCRFYKSTSPLVKADQRQKVNELRSLYDKSSASVKRLVEIKDSLELSHLDNYERAIETVKKEIDRMVDKRRKLKEDLIQRLKRHNPVVEIHDRTVPINIICLIHPGNYSYIKRTCFNDNQLISTFQSVWNRDKRQTHMEFKGYKYVWNGQLISYESNTYFCTIENQSPFVQDHWKVNKAMHIAIQKIENGFPNSVQIEIRGQGKIKRLPTPEDIDVVGTEEENSEWRNYHFELISISNVVVDGQKLELPNSVETIYSELADFMLEVNREVENLENQHAEKQLDLNTLENMKKLISEGLLLQKYSQIYEEIEQKIDELLSFPLFRSIELEEPNPLVPTQLFLHDPYYQSIWRLLQSLEEEIGLSLIPEKTTRNLGVKKVEQLFETWCLFKIILILTEEMGWSLKNYDNAIQCIDHFLGASNNGELTGFKAQLVLNSWVIEILYEPTIYILKDGTTSHEKTVKRTPDYVFRIYQNGIFRGNVYLDAKHKNFIDQGEEELKKELLKTAINKYGKMIPIDFGENTLASFLIHSDISYGMSKEQSGENYYAYYNRNLFPNALQNSDANEAHKYGAIYLLPSATHAFKNWFRMLMEFRLGEYTKCWTCGCLDNVEVEERFTINGYPKYYFTCKKCGEFWVRVHCHYGHKIIKHSNNYHRQVFHNYSWYTVCPTCGDGF